MKTLKTENKNQKEIANELIKLIDKKHNSIKNKDNPKEIIEAYWSMFKALDNDLEDWSLTL